MKNKEKESFVVPRVFSTPSSFCKQRHSEHFSRLQDDQNSPKSESCSLTLTSAQTRTIVLAELEHLGGHKTSLKYQIR